MITDQSIEEQCLSVYEETREFYREVQPLMGEHACGFKVLYGPPLREPPVLFLGYQPGGSNEDDKREQAWGVRERWPNTLEYVSQKWTLAKRMQEMFGTDLARCVGLNAVFFRAPNIEKWETVPRNLRTRVNSFCLQRVAKIIRAIQPGRVVAIGFKTLEPFGPTSPDLVNEKGRVLTKSGIIASYPSLGTLHLSGAQISRADRRKIAERTGLV